MQSQTTPEIPNFKLAKVGKDRRRRGAGFGWLGGSGPGSGFLGGAAGAAGGGGLASAMGPLLIAAVLAATAWQASRGFFGADAANHKTEKVFADKSASADMPTVINDNVHQMPNSLGYVSGSIDGLTPEERAKKAAEAEAARKAQEEADKKAADEAAKADAKKNASDGVDPSALAKQLAGQGDQKAGGLGGKFGKLSSGLGGGGGLAGGAGMSGGVGRGFANLSSGGPQGKSGTKGKLSGAMTAKRPSVAAAPHSTRPSSKAQGFGMRQLMTTAQSSRQATGAGRAETASGDAGVSFDNGAGQGNVIEGAGVTNSGHGGVTGDSSGGGNPNGGPIGSGTPPAAAPVTPPSSNVTPYQGLMDLANKLLLAAMVLSLIIAVLKYSGYGLFLVPYLLYAVAALGAMIALIGVTLMVKYGQTEQGLILTAVGGITAYLAYTGIPSAQAAVEQGAGSLVNGIGNKLTWMAGDPVPVGTFS